MDKIVISRTLEESEDDFIIRLNNEHKKMMLKSPHSKVRLTKYHIPIENLKGYTSGIITLEPKASSAAEENISTIN